MREGFVASDPELIAVRMPLQDVGYLGGREPNLRHIRCTTGEMHRLNSTSDSMVVNDVSKPGIDEYGAWADRFAQIAQDATELDRVGDQMKRR